MDWPPTDVMAALIEKFRRCEGIADGMLRDCGYSPENAPDGLRQSLLSEVWMNEGKPLGDPAGVVKRIEKAIKARAQRKRYRTRASTFAPAASAEAMSVQWSMSGSPQQAATAAVFATDGR